MKLVRVVGQHFVAGFETDGTVKNCAPILKRHLAGKSDDEAREIIRQQGWKASVVAEYIDEPKTF